MDNIFIEKLKIFANHGVYDFEKEEGQYFYVDARLFFDTHGAGISDDLDQTVNYARACELIKGIITEKTYNLIEAVAEEVANALLINFAMLDSVDITIYKPQAPIDMDFDNISVNINRKWHRIYLGVGSNMGDKMGYINGALCQLNSNPKIKEVRCSSIIETRPYGGVEQDNFCNGAIEAKTLYTPMELLDALHDIEKAANRERKIHWGPRTLDLDILFYDDVVMSTTELTIPHMDMANRDFVLIPLLELCPFYVNHAENLTVKQMYERLTLGYNDNSTML